MPHFSELQVSRARLQHDGVSCLFELEPLFLRAFGGREGLSAQQGIEYGLSIGKIDDRWSCAVQRLRESVRVRCAGTGEKVWPKCRTVYSGGVLRNVVADLSHC